MRGSTVHTFVFSQCNSHIFACIDYHDCLFYSKLAGLPGFARDNFSIMMAICAFHFYIIYFKFFCADHDIPQTFDETLMPRHLGYRGLRPLGHRGATCF